MGQIWRLSIHHKMCNPLAIALPCRPLNTAFQSACRDSRCGSCVWRPLKSLKFWIIFYCRNQRLLNLCWQPNFSCDIFENNVHWRLPTLPRPFNLFNYHNQKKLLLLINFIFLFFIFYLNGIKIKIEWHLWSWRFFANKSILASTEFVSVTRMWVCRQVYFKIWL